MSLERNLQLSTSLTKVNKAWIEFLAWASAADEELSKGFGQIVAHDDRAAYKFLGMSFPIIANATASGDEMLLEIWLTNPKPKSADIGPWYFSADRRFLVVHPTESGGTAVDVNESSEPQLLLDFLSEAILASNVFKPSTGSEAHVSSRA